MYREYFIAFRLVGVIVLSSVITNKGSTLPLGKSLIGGRGLLAHLKKPSNCCALFTRDTLSASVSSLFSSAASAAASMVCAAAVVSSEKRFNSAVLSALRCLIH